MTPGQKNGPPASRSESGRQARRVSPAMLRPTASWVGELNRAEEARKAIP